MRWIISGICLLVGLGTVFVGWNLWKKRSVWKNAERVRAEIRSLPISINFESTMVAEVNYVFSLHGQKHTIVQRVDRVEDLPECSGVIVPARYDVAKKKLIEEKNLSFSFLFYMVLGMIGMSVGILIMIGGESFWTNVSNFEFNKGTSLGKIYSILFGMGIITIGIAVGERFRKVSVKVIRYHFAFLHPNKEPLIAKCVQKIRQENQEVGTTYYPVLACQDGENSYTWIVDAMEQDLFQEEKMYPIYRNRKNGTFYIPMNGNSLFYRFFEVLEHGLFMVGFMTIVLIGLAFCF